jgi:hypothetical protein
MLPKVEILKFPTLEGICGLMGFTYNLSSPPPLTAQECMSSDKHKDISPNDPKSRIWKIPKLLG